eukprot:GHVN01008235.1.p1 GENE.GHVN01008235.1~~GHVN01008235.1.p1  ORF type:complete len:130 (-),score=21.90 GHVN01008235.1:31-420(-)
MQAENFSKLTVILDLLDRYQKYLDAASRIAPIPTQRRRSSSSTSQGRPSAGSDDGLKKLASTLSAMGSLDDVSDERVFQMRRRKTIAMLKAPTLARAKTKRMADSESISLQFPHFTHDFSSFGAGSMQQ